jgi:uncharacterized protein (DUF433 family)
MLETADRTRRPVDGRKRWQRVYSTRETSVLSGATPDQLLRWRQDAGDGPWLRAATDERGGCWYRFADLVAIRLFLQRRGAWSLPRLQRAVARLDGERRETHLTGAGLRAAAGSGPVCWLSPDGDYLGVVEPTGQPGTRVVLSDVHAEFTTPDGRVVPDLRRPTPGIAVDPGVRGGGPVLVGTRLRYNEISHLADDGVDVAGIRAWYPGATADTIAGAVRFARLVEQAAAAPSAA